MTRAKSESLGSVGSTAFTYWANENISPQAEDHIRSALKSLSIDSEAFIAWFRVALGEYRSAVAIHVDQPEVAAVVAWMRLAAKESEEAFRDGRFTRMPPLADAAVYYAAYQAGDDWEAVINRRDSDAAARFCRQGSAALSKQKPKVGRPNKAARDSFFLAVCGRLGAAAEEKDVVDRIAREIMAACSVPKPPSPESIDRSTRRRKSSGQ